MSALLGVLLPLPLLLAAQGKDGGGKDGAGKAEPGKLSDLRARNGWTYALRIPKSYDGKRGARALVILHGSNMSGRAYLDTVVAAGWFADDLLLGPDGPIPGSEAGAHNFEEGSAKGVAEVFDEDPELAKNEVGAVGDLPGDRTGARHDPESEPDEEWTAASTQLDVHPAR